MGQACCHRIQVEKFQSSPDAQGLDDKNDKEPDKSDKRSSGEDALSTVTPPLVEHPPQSTPQNRIQSRNFAELPPSPNPAKPSPPINNNNGDWEQCDVPREHRDSNFKSYLDQDIAELETLPTDSESVHGRIGKPFTFMTGATYLGQWKGNARDGFGIQQWPDGARYEGEWVANRAEGQGKSVHVDGNTFIGQWKNNMAEGIGVYYQRHPWTTYEGQWVKDLQHGDGMQRWHDQINDGSLYEGQYYLGKMEGCGVYHWSDGSVYEGEWFDNTIQGNGSFVGKDGRRFRGQWRGMSIHGAGQSLWPNGQTYAGQYTNDRRNGFGVLTLPDGKQFEGWWKDGRLAVE